MDLDTVGDKRTGNNLCEEKSDSSKKESNIQKWMITISLVLTWFCMGSSLEMAGPTLQDFIKKLQSNYDYVTGAISYRNIGEFLGGVIGGVMVDKLGRFCYLIIGLSLTALGLTSLLLPFVNDLSLLGFQYFLLGVLLGIINIAGQRSILWTWGDKAASPLHALHMGYGIGALMAPLIANPYLESYRTHYDNVHEAVESTELNETVTGNNTSSASSVSGFNVYKAYIIVSTYTFVLSLTFCIFYFYKHFSKKTTDVTSQALSENMTLLEMINPATCANGDCWFGSVVLTLLFFYYFGIVGAERIWGTFIRSYSIDEWEFPGNSGSYINTAFWISFSFGRFSGFIIARFISIKIIMVCESVTFLLTSVLLLVILPGSTLPLWILTIFSGLMCGPMYPTGISWANIYLNMTGVAITFIVLGGGFGGYAFTKLIGHLYDVFGPKQFVYLNFAVAVFILILIVMMTSVITFRKHIFQRNYTELGIENKNENTSKEIDK